MTFLFTDVQDSTRLWEADHKAMRQALARHDEIVERVVTEHSGVVVRPRGEGDSRFAVFARAGDAVEGALAIQLALSSEPWPMSERLLVRLALHTGEADLRDGDYYGSAVNRCARLRAIAHGGQVLLSGVTAQVVKNHLPEAISLRALGSHRLKDLGEPEQVYQLCHTDLPAEYPPLNSLDAYPNNLPQEPRSVEIEEVEAVKERKAEPSGARVRVLVVDDQRLMRDGLASLLSLQAGVEVIGTAANGQEAIHLALEARPDVVLMDVRMPVLDGVAATSEMKRQLPECQVLMLTTFDDEEYVIEALRAGATGYLLKDMPAHDLARAIEAAHKRIYQLDPSVASKVVASFAVTNAASSNPNPSVRITTPGSVKGSREAGRAFDELTSREVDVLRLIARGATNREIAEALVITEGTVKNHISSILSRLGLRDRTQAALYAREAGLL